MKSKRELTITLDSETLDLLDHFLPNMTSETIELFIRTLLKQAGMQAVKHDKMANRDFKEYMKTHPKGHATST